MDDGNAFFMPGRMLIATAVNIFVVIKFWRWANGPLTALIAAAEATEACVGARKRHFCPPLSGLFV